LHDIYTVVNEGMCDESYMHSLHVSMHAYVQLIVVTTVDIATPSYKPCDDEYQT
jgi:hypothetical protein